MSLNDEIKIADFGLAQFTKSLIEEDIQSLNNIRNKETDVEMTSGVGTLF